MKECDPAILVEHLQLPQAQIKISTVKHFHYLFFFSSFPLYVGNSSDHGTTFQLKFIPLSFFMEYNTV